MQVVSIIKDTSNLQLRVEYNLYKVCQRMPCGRLPGYMWHTTCTRGAKLACMWLGHNFTLSSKWKLLIDALSRFDQVTGLHQLCWRHGLWSERSDLSTASMFTRLLLPQLCNDHHPHPRCSASLARGFRVLDKFVCDLTWVWYNMSITRIRMAYTLSLTCTCMQAHKKFSGYLVLWQIQQFIRRLG